MEVEMVNKWHGLDALVDRLRKWEEELMSELMRRVVKIQDSRFFIFCTIYIINYS